MPFTRDDIKLWMRSGEVFSIRSRDYPCFEVIFGKITQYPEDYDFRIHQGSGVLNKGNKTLLFDELIIKEKINNTLFI